MIGLKTSDKFSVSEIKETGLFPLKNLFNGVPSETLNGSDLESISDILDNRSSEDREDSGKSAPTPDGIWDSEMESERRGRENTDGFLGSNPI